MPKYVVIVEDGVNLERVKLFFSDHRRVDDRTVIIRSFLTSKDISNILFPLDKDGKPSATHIVLRFDAWWGLHQRDLWEWMDQKKE